MKVPIWNNLVWQALGKKTSGFYLSKYYRKLPTKKLNNRDALEKGFVIKSSKKKSHGENTFENKTEKRVSVRDHELNFE